MKIIVTGAAGFVGSHFAEKLAKQKFSVVGIDAFRNYYSPEVKKMNAEDVVAAGGKIVRKDLAVDDVSKDLHDAEMIFHFAAQPGISDQTPFLAYVENNIIATQKLLAAAEKLPTLKLFVYISTSSVYGAHATDNEESAPKPTSYYGVTKLASEQLVLSYQRDRGLPTCSFRLFSVYGPRERPEKLYPKLIKSILNDQPFPLYEGSLSHTRTFTYVDDIVRGLQTAISFPDRCVGEIFNMGSDVEITTQRGIEIIENVLQKKAIMQNLPRRSGDQLRTRADISKIRERLGYEPTTPPEEGLQKEVEWYLDRIHGKIDYR